MVYAVDPITRLVLLCTRPKRLVMRRAEAPLCSLGAPVPVTLENILATKDGMKSTEAVVSDAVFLRRFDVLHMDTGIHLQTWSGPAHVSPTAVGFPPSSREPGTVVGGCCSPLLVWTSTSHLPDGSEKEPRTVLQFPSLGTLVQTVGLLTRIHSLAFHPTKALMVAGDAHGFLQVWQIGATDSEHQILHSFHAHAGSVTSLQFSGDGHSVISGGTDGVVVVWRVDSTYGGVKGGLRNQSWSPVNSVATNYDGSVVVAGYADGGVKVWSTKSQRLEFISKNHSAPVRAVATDRSGRLIASASQDGEMRLRSLSDLGYRLSFTCDFGDWHSDVLQVNPFNVSLSIDDGGAKIVLLTNGGVLYEWQCKNKL